MTREEAKKIIIVIASAYPNFKPNNLTAVVDAWHFFLADYDCNDIAIALKTYVATSGSSFAPSASELIAITYKADEYAQLTDAEAWALVNKALRNSTYNAQKEFDALPEIIQKCVGSASQLHSWASTNEGALDTVIASNFKKAYKTMTDREREIKRLPVETRARLGGLYEQARLEAKC